MWSRLQDHLGYFGPKEGYMLIWATTLRFWKIKKSGLISWEAHAEKYMLQVPTERKKAKGFFCKAFATEAAAAREALVAFHLSKAGIFPEFGSLYHSKGKWYFTMQTYPEDMFTFLTNDPPRTDIVRVLEQTTACVARLLPSGGVIMLDLKPSNVVVCKDDIKLIDADPEFVIFLDGKLSEHHSALLSAANLVIFYLQFWGHAGLLFQSDSTLRFYRRKLREIFLSHLAKVAPSVKQKHIVYVLVLLSLNMHNTKRSGISRRRSPLCTLEAYLVSSKLKNSYNCLSLAQKKLLLRLRSTWFSHDTQWGGDDETDITQLFEDLLTLTDINPLFP